MLEIVLLGSVHKENGRCNPSELVRILKLIQPNVLFQEIPYFKFLDKKDTYRGNILEVQAISEYLKLHGVLQIPVDTIDPSSFEHGKFDEVVDRVIHAGPDLGHLLEEHTYREKINGFEYLNSRLNERMLRRIDFAFAKTLEQLKDERLAMAYGEWKAYNSSRDAAMVANVYEFCRQNTFSKGVFLFGSAHRAGLIARIQMVKKTQEVRVNWKLDWR